MHRTTYHPRLRVTAGGGRIVSHAGAGLLSDVADAVGLTAELSTALAETQQRQRGHDRGFVLVNLAAPIADGATCLSDLDLFLRQPEVFGPGASVPTTWRTLTAVDDDAATRIADARAIARAHAWAAGMDPGFYVIDIDGTLLTAHSEKEQAAPTYQRGFGFCPLLAFLDQTGKAWPASFEPATRGPGRRRITSRCWMRRWHSSRWIPTSRRSSSAPTAPGVRTSSWPMARNVGCGSWSAIP